MNKTFKESNYDQIVCCYAAKDWFITEKLNQEGIDELVAKLSEVLKGEEKDEVLSKSVEMYIESVSHYSYEVIKNIISTYDNMRNIVSVIQC